MFMKVSTHIFIEAPLESVWHAITDIEHAQEMITGIIGLEILEQSENQLIGLKWKETRLMFGKEAIETMWITDSVNHQFYRTRAESHGSIYISELAVQAKDNGTVLTMSFSGKAQTAFMKFISVLMTPFMKGSMIKMLDKDLVDIKQFVESKAAHSA